MLNTKITYFDNAKITKGTEITIQNFINIVKGCDFEHKINQIRAESDQKKRNELKQNLPCITTSGLFEGGRAKANLILHSGLLQVDFDKLANFELAYTDLKRDIYTSVLFVSPSGTGLKVFVKIPSDTEKHLESFEGLESYYLKKYSLVMDKSTKDITRLCYVSADKKIFVNENAPAFTREKETKNEPKETINKKKVDFTNQDKYKEVERILDKINFDITQNYNEWIKIGFAFSHHFGENGRDFFHKVSACYPKYDYQETDKQFTTCLNTNTGQTKINTFFEIAKNKGIDISLPKNEKHHTQSQPAPKHSTPLATPTQTATEHTTESPQEIAQNKLKNNYARIGTNYYLVLKGETPQTWNKETILDDFGKHFKTKQEILDSVPKYTGFAIAPDNINYKREINGKYNLYEPLASTPSEGNTTKIHDFLKHIFTDKYPLALDYLTILYRFPKQNLPILCLVSEERSTGKSTFLHFLKEIFKFNCTILGNEDFNGKFNSHYATKNIICVDESFIEKSNNEIIERLKRLNTDTKIYNNMKGIDSKEIDFFGKFILCSNRETDFIKIDKKENRFWVNLVPKYTTEKPELLGEICQQIPAFLYELHHRKITHDKKTRLWFDTKLFETQANDKIKENSKSNLEQLFNIYVHEKCEIIAQNEFNRTLNEILADFEKSYKNEKISIIDLKNFLQNDKKLVPSNSTGYIYYIFENYKPFISEEGEEIESQKPKTEKRKGKFYTLKNQDF